MGTMVKINEVILWHNGHNGQNKPQKDNNLIRSFLLTEWSTVLVNLIVTQLFGHSWKLKFHYLVLKDPPLGLS